MHGTAVMGSEPGMGAAVTGQRTGRKPRHGGVCVPPVGVTGRGRVLPARLTLPVRGSPRALDQGDGLGARVHAQFAVQVARVGLHGVGR